MSATRSLEVSGQVIVCTREIHPAGRKNQGRAVVDGYALWCSVCGDIDVEGSSEYSSLKYSPDFAVAARCAAEHLTEVHNITTPTQEYT